MQKPRKTVWYDDPKIAGDTAYWKPKLEVWLWSATASYILALAINVFAPFAEQVKPWAYRFMLISFIAALIFLYFFAIKWSGFRKKLYHKAQFIFAGGIALTVWDLLTAKSGLLPLPYFPSVGEIFNAMFEDRYLLARSSLYSLRLFFVGLITGAAVGLATGVLIGWIRQWDYWLSPVIRISGIVPAVAWLPIALVVFPTSFTTGVFLIVISSWFPVSSMTAQGVHSTPKSYFEAARTLGADNKFLLFRVAIPHALPSLFTGVTTATAFSFTTLIVSEMVGAKAGLGFYINWAKGWGVYSKVYGAIIIIAIEFALILTIVGAARNRALRWQRGFLK
jgi:NitT/TauT family transport system permease protein